MFFRKPSHKSRKKNEKYLTKSLLAHIKPVDIFSSEYLFVFSQEKSSFQKRLYILIARELSLMDIPSIFLYQKDSISSRFSTLSINGYQISNSLNYGKAKGDIESNNLNGYYFDWKVDIENQTIEAYNTNFYPIILTTLRTVQKRYNVNYYNSNNEIVFEYLIKSCDLLLKYFLLLKDFSSKNSKKIKIVGFETNYIPNSVFQILCDKFSNDRDIEYIALSRGYIAYFGKHHFRESFITCNNLTKEKLSLGIAVNKDQLSAIDTKKINFDALSESSLKAVNKKVFSKFSNKKNNVISNINNYIKENRKVFVLFTHLFYDVTIDDSSPSFKDMCEWIKLTIDYFEKNGNLLLLKPHPVEIRPDEPKKIPNETLKSFLNNIKLPKNIILLEPNDFSLPELVPYLSCGLIWRSSVGMELTFLEVPTIIAGTPIYRALPLNYPQNQQHYFQMIDNVKSLGVTESQKKEVAKYLYLLEKKHIHVDSITYDVRSRKILWDRKALEKYLATGDAKIRSIAKKMLK
jgi:hypothetical protein